MGLPEVVPDHDMLYPAPRVPPEGDTKMEPFPPLHGTLLIVLETLIAGGCVIVKLVATGQLLLSSIETLYVPEGRLFIT